MWRPGPIHFVVTELTSTGQRVNNLRQKDVQACKQVCKHSVSQCVSTPKGLDFSMILVPLASCEWQASRGCGRCLLPRIDLCTEASGGHNAGYSGADSSSATPAADFHSPYRRQTTVLCSCSLRTRKHTQSTKAHVSVRKVCMCIQMTRR